MSLQERYTSMSDSPTIEAENGGLVVVSADRTEEEIRETYGAEWVSPINEMTVLDRVASLFRKSD